jgi:hypothetical protein
MKISFESARKTKQMRKEKLGKSFLETFEKSTEKFSGTFIK